MFRRSLLALLINCLAAVTVLDAQPAQRGAIEGRVFDADRANGATNYESIYNTMAKGRTYSFSVDKKL